MRKKPVGISKKRWDKLKGEIMARRLSNRKARDLTATSWDPSAQQVNKVQSIWDRISDIEIEENGKVSSNYILMEKSNPEMPFRRYQFSSVSDYLDWKGKNEERYMNKIKARLTPHQFHLTQLKHGMERAFTGEYWWTNDVGRYDCISCTQRLFMYDHKYINRSGFPTFWNSLENAVKFVSDNLSVNVVTNAHECPTLKGKTPVKRCVCSNCEAHLGYVYDDGPPPLGLRYQINSVALNFQLKPWFEAPKSPFMVKRKTREL